jgi:hypothetical protein
MTLRSDGSMSAGSAIAMWLCADEAVGIINAIATAANGLWISRRQNDDVKTVQEKVKTGCGEMKSEKNEKRRSWRQLEQGGGVLLLSDLQDVRQLEVLHELRHPRLVLTEIRGTSEKSQL